MHGLRLLLQLLPAAYAPSSQCDAEAQRGVNGSSSNSTEAEKRTRLLTVGFIIQTPRDVVTVASEIHSGYYLGLPYIVFEQKHYLFLADRN